MQIRLMTILLMTAASTACGEDRIESPDGKVAVAFTLQKGGVPAYRIEYLSKPIVLESRLGLEPNFTDGFALMGTTKDSHEGHWTNPFGERKTVPDNYRELNVNLKHSSGRLVRLTFRAYNEGAALRYTFPQQNAREFVFTGERTEFRFPDNTFGYEAHGTEGEYRRVPTGAIRPFCERPLTLEYGHGAFTGLSDAANQAYPRMLLSPLAGVPGALVSALGGDTSNTERPNQRHAPKVSLKAGDSTPWRMFVVGEKPGDLLERNHLMLNLNPPNALTDTSWIRPGKAIREVSLSTVGGLACVDFAVKHGLQYVHFDAGWYGRERSTPTATSVDPSRDLDLKRVIDYGASKGIGAILYVNRLALVNQIDTLPALYRSWGVKGIKFGFVDVGSQQDTLWLLEAIRKCAAHQIMVNVHDGYRATGCERTWPNLMTVEGIRGNEHMPTPEHNCTLPFTRYVAGIGDYTVCYYSDRIKTTHTHQLAMAVVSFSPLQWVFWYDRPSQYNGEPEVEFFSKVPTVWDDTKVIHGRIGEYATIARRSGEDWFIGTINNSQARALQIPLSFLTPGKIYTAHIYADDPTVQTRTQVGIKTQPVDVKSVLDIPLLPAGGQAVWITPAATL